MTEMDRPKCFVCTGEIQCQRSGFSNSTHNSILLCQILEMPHLGNDARKLQINYCNSCMDRILSVRDMLEDLERLEKEVLDKKYFIEVQLKQNSQNYEHQNLSQKLRDEIVTELRSTSVESILDKIRLRQLGQSQTKTRNGGIMKDSTNPQVWTLRNETTAPILSENRIHAQNENIRLLSLPLSTSPRSTARGSVQGVSPQVPKKRRISNRQRILENTLQAEMDEIQPDYSTVPASHNLPFNSEEPMRPYDIEEYDIKIEPLEYQIEPIDSFDGFQTEHRIISDSEVTTEIPSRGTICQSAAAGTRNVANIVEESQSLFLFKVTNFVPDTTEGNPPHQPYICGICGSSFAEYNQLKGHHRAHKISKTKSPNKYRIPIPFLNRSKQKVKPSDTPKECDECGKILSTHGNWKNHVMTLHRGHYKYKCTYAMCNYSCQRQTHLEKHLQDHSRGRKIKTKTKTNEKLKRA